MSDPLILGIIVAIAVPLSTVMTVILNQAFTFFTRREERNNAKEDREREKQERAEVALQVKMATEAAQLAAALAAKTANESAQAIEVVHAAVKEVGEQATAAYKEANQSNLKIQGLQKVLTVALNLPDVPITASTGANEGKATD
jgi:hypothetical protein